MTKLIYFCEHEDVIRLISVIFVSFIIFLVSFSPALGALRAEPISRSPFNQRDRYETDLFTGTAAYSYPIKTPKGTNDLTPEVSLSYNSAGARDLMQRSGAGWQLSHDYIERDVNYSPTNLGDDKFRLHFKGGVHDLVYVSSENRYHTKAESFLNIQKLSGGQNEQSEYWQVISQDGTKYRFGFQNQSELLCAGRSYIYLWNLDQAEDTHSNKIFYNYLENVGLSYLAKIEYNSDKSRVIDFIYSTIPSRHLYIQGCGVIESSRLSAIQVKTNNALIGQYDLNYQQNGPARFLQSITEKGSDGSALPAATFTYKPEVKNWATTSDNKWIDHASIDAPLNSSSTALIDVNGDDLPDIVKTIHHGGPSVSWKVLLNQGNSWSTQFQFWVDNVPMEDARLDRASQDVRLIDVTGDNLPDIVMAAGADSWRVWRNTGTSWNTQYEPWANLSSVHSEVNLSNSRVRLVDVTGDGLPDIVRTWVNGQQQWEVYKNLGNSWSSSPEVWSFGTISQGLDDPTLFVMDVNGDGLADVVKTHHNGTLATWEVFKNTGSWWAPSELWINSENIDAYFSKDDVTVSDVDGDGLPDIIKSDDLGTADRWKVLRNWGNSWSTTWETWIDPSSNVDIGVHNNHTRLADATGDGLTDIVVGEMDCSCAENTYRVWKNNGKASNLLDSVKTSQGGTISFDYKASTAFDNTGADEIADLPFNLWVVEKKTENNGMTAAHLTNDVTTYTYKDGLYKWQDREFRGFGTIDENLPDTSKKKYVFHQDDALKGLLAEVQTRDSQNNPYAESENVWSSSQVNGIITVKLAQEKNYIFDGSASNPKVTQTGYDYDSFGNVSRKAELGDTSVSGDERFTYYEYTTNPTLWIINTLKHSYLNKSDDATKVSENWFYYDGHSALDDGPTKGDLTKEVKWLEGGTNPATLYEYDSFGNQSKTTDANNRLTQFAYDTTGTYQVSTTNAKNQTSTVNYDLGTGNLLSRTDPNNFATSYEYDVFGRLIKEIKQYDSSAFASLNYQYFFDGTAPEGVFVSKREVSGSGGTIDLYTWGDGFGRKLQTRADAEDASKQSVVNTFYDPNGEIKKEMVAHLDNVSSGYVTPVSGIRTTEMSYDPLERVTSVKNPKGDVRSIAYDHWKVTETDEKGHVKKKYFNANDKINKVEEVNSGSTYDTLYEYDSRDLLTKITDAANNITAFVYDTLGRKKSQTDPDMGIWNYTYDGVGNLLNQTDNRNIATIRTYDELNRIIGVNYPNDTDAAYTYDGNGKTGTLTSVVDTAGTANYTYDNRLRKIQEQRTVNGTTKTTQFSYDAADRTVTQTNPDGEVVTYAFNPQGEINSVNGLVNNIDYNALGKVTSKTFANNLTTNYTYNTDDFRLNRIQTGSLFDKNYAYDQVGNVLGVTNNLTSKTESFGYDDLDRLKTASETAGYSYAYDYNSIGNLTKFTNTGLVTDYSYGIDSTKPHALIAQVMPGFSAEYYNNTTLSGSPIVTRTDGAIDFDWGNGSPDATIPNDNFSARWTKIINFEAGNYVFSTTTDDGVRLYIDNQLVIDKWIGQSAVTHTTVQNMSAGNHTVKMEYFEGGGGAVARFNYQKLTQDFTGEYYGNKNLSGTPVLVRNDTSVNFDWNTAAPEASLPIDNFSTRWTKIQNFAGGTYEFSITGDDGISLYIDDELVINGWKDQGTTIYKAIKAVSGGNHRIRVQYYDSGWTALAQFSYTQVSGSFTGEYFNNKTLSGSPAITRNDAIINFEWGDGSPDANIQNDNFSARWTGTHNLAAGGYEFSITGDDGVRLYIDNNLVIDKWIDQGPSTYTTAQFLSSGDHTIKMEYYESGGGASAKYSYRKILHNFQGEYFTNKTLTGTPLFTRTDSFINFDWGTGSPDAAIPNDNFSTRWTKTDTFSAGDYEFSVTSDDGVRLYVDNNLVIDKWIDQGPTTYTTTQTLSAGNHTIKMEYYDSGWTAVAKFNAKQLNTSPIYLNQGTTSNSGTAYTYDANGNMTSNSVDCYEYNEANQLAKVKKCSNNQTVAEYVYDYDGLRMVKRNFTNGTLANTVISWSDSYETKVIAGGATENTTYYFVNNELVAKKNPDGSKYYYHNDHLGSSSILTNQSGALVEETKYDPWGEVKSGGVVSKFQYTGQEKDIETGLNYYNFRYYDSHIRRFTQPDDIIQDWYDPQSLNRYSYVRNNPLTYTDPTGHVAVVPILIAAGISGVVGGLADVAEVNFQNPNAQFQDYAVAFGKGFAINAPLGAAGFMGGIAASTVVAKTTLAPVVKQAISLGVTGGGFGLAQSGVNNLVNNKPFLNNYGAAIGTGIASAGLANKIAPAIAGRPLSPKISLNANIGKKSVNEVSRHGVADFVNNLTVRFATQVVSNVKNVLKAPIPKFKPAPARSFFRA